MTKREEVREGIAKLTEDRFRFPAGSAGVDWDRNFNHMLAEDILSYLHSQGLVIKVDRELPSIRFKNIDLWQASQITQKDMLKAGYVAVEPLIGGK